MAPFRWRDTKHDIALALEVAAAKPDGSQYWEIIAKKLGTLFSTEDKPVELKGRGCRERMHRLLEKFEQEDARSLKRSGTEEEYGELSQLLEDISTYRRDCIEAKQNEKERKMKKEVADRKQAEHIRQLAMGNLVRKRSVSLSTDESSDDNENDSTLNDPDEDISPKKVGKKKKKKFSRMSALDMLSEKYKKKTDLKEKELNVRMSELEFEKQKFNLELEERKQRHKIEMEERQVMIDLLKKKL